MPNVSVLVNFKNVSLNLNLRSFKTVGLWEQVKHFLMGPFSKERKRAEKLILKNINLEIHQGDRIALIGANGAGKSTICRLIAGMYEPHRGEICILGNVRALFESGMVLYPELTGRENAKVLATLYFKDYPDEIEEIVNESVQFSELGEKIDHPMKTYSNGMIVRLTMSILSSRPTDILILDEVFDGADEFFRAKINARVRSMINQSGAVIFVSHYRELVKEICNRAILIVDGSLVFDGSIEDTYQIYSNNK